MVGNCHEQAAWDEAQQLAQQPSVLSTHVQVRNKRGGPVLVLKVIQFDVSSDVVRKQVSSAEHGSRL